MPKICIDAGHNYSGGDTGAQGNGLREERITFPIANKLKSLLEGIGVTVIMTRPTLETSLGTTLNESLSKRSQISNTNNCDYFISIHCNAGGGVGTETYAYSAASKGYPLAQAVQKSLVNSLPLKNRGTKTANFAVLRATNAPAILVETAFIDNIGDATLLRDRQDDFANAIFKGVCDYLGIKTASEPKFQSSVDDLMNELMWRSIIEDRQLWADRGNDDINLRYLYDKYYWYLIKNSGSVKAYYPTFDEAINIYIRCGLMNSPDVWRDKAKEDITLQWFIIKTASYIN